MREAFGGAFMIRLVLVFLVLYISFMAVAVNYAKVFRIKNHIINILEQHQYNGEEDGKNTDSGAIKAIDEYTEKVHYNVGDQNREKLEKKCNGVWRDSGVCITPAEDCNANNNSCYYKVTVYITVDLPFYFTQNVDFIHSLPISGETRTIVYY